VVIGYRLKLEGSIHMLARRDPHHNQAERGSDLRAREKGSVMDLGVDWTRSEIVSVRSFLYMGRQGPAAGSQTAGRFGFKFTQISRGLTFEIHDAGRHYGRL
jgi:hypothetical protein